MSHIYLFKFDIQQTVQAKRGGGGLPYIVGVYIGWNGLFLALGGWWELEEFVGIHK